MKVEYKGMRVKLIPVLYAVSHTRIPSLFYKSVG